jgi:hypothetical protein
MDPNSLPSDSIFPQVPRIGDLPAQSPAETTTIPPLPTELRLHILEYTMHMIKEPLIILDLHAMPRGKPLKGKQIRFLPAPSREDSPWVSIHQRRTLGLLGALKNSPQLSFYQQRTLGLLGASKECRDFYFLHFPIVLPCGRDCHSQLRIAKDEVLHILNFSNKLGSEHVYQAIGDSYLIDEWWSQLERISFGSFYFTSTFFEQLIFIITKMNSLKVVDLLVSKDECIWNETWYQDVIEEFVETQNQSFGLDYQMPQITFRTR